MNSNPKPNSAAVRVTGSQQPAYLMGRPASLYIQAYAAKPAVITPRFDAISADLNGTGTRVGEGVPFAAMYMTRADKKSFALVTAA